MPIPESVKVGPYRYAVHTSEEAVRNMQRDHPNWDAQTDYHLQTITLDTTCGPDALAENMLHEVIHVIHYAVGLGSDEKLTAHENIYRTTAIMLQVLRDNPELVVFLVER